MGDLARRDQGHVILNELVPTAAGPPRSAWGCIGGLIPSHAGSATKFGKLISRTEFALWLSVRFVLYREHRQLEVSLTYRR